MTTTAPRPISVLWIVISVLLFCGVELFLGGFVGRVVTGRYFSPMLAMRLQVLLSLGSFFVGGFLIGVITPGLRMIEPAIGAAISVFLTLLIAVFLPSVFMQMTFDKLLIGGAIAFALAYGGAYLGEKLMGNIRK